MTTISQQTAKEIAEKYLSENEIKGVLVETAIEDDNGFFVNLKTNNYKNFGLCHAHEIYYQIKKQSNGVVTISSKSYGFSILITFLKTPISS